MKEITIEFQDINEQISFVETINIEDGDRIILTVPINEQSHSYPIKPETAGKFAKMFVEGMKNNNTVFVLPELMKVKLLRA